MQCVFFVDFLITAAKLPFLLVVAITINSCFNLNKVYSLKFLHYENLIITGIK